MNKYIEEKTKEFNEIVVRVDGEKGEWVFTDEIWEKLRATLIDCQKQIKEDIIKRIENMEIEKVGNSAHTANQIIDIIKATK